MDALMAALVAALLTHASDRTAWLGAILGTRYRALAVTLGIGLVLLLSNALAAIGGALLAPQMSPNARNLLLALALLSGGIGAFWPAKPPRLRESWRVGPFLIASLGAAILALGDRTLFITAALAARAASPAAAAIGATLGALAIVVPSVLLGERGRRKLPLTAIRFGTGALLTIVGAVQALGALRLI